MLLPYLCFQNCFAFYLYGEFSSQGNTWFHMGSPSAIRQSCPRWEQADPSFMSMVSTFPHQAEQKMWLWFYLTFFFFFSLESLQCQNKFQKKLHLKGLTKLLSSIFPLPERQDLSFDIGCQNWFYSAEILWLSEKCKIRQFSA